MVEEAGEILLFSYSQTATPKVYNKAKLDDSN
jgi:hypothetical protein